METIKRLPECQVTKDIKVHVSKSPGYVDRLAVRSDFLMELFYQHVDVRLNNRFLLSQCYFRKCVRQQTPLPRMSCSVERCLDVRAVRTRDEETCYI